VPSSLWLRLVGRGISTMLMPLVSGSVHLCTSPRNPQPLCSLLPPLRNAPVRGSAKNCAIFPIASFLGLTMVALLHSKHDDKGSTVNQINIMGATRDHVAFDYGCFSVFRGETTLQNWSLRTGIALSKRTIRLKARIVFPCMS